MSLTCRVFSRATSFYLSRLPASKPNRFIKLCVNYMTLSDRGTQMFFLHHHTRSITHATDVETCWKCGRSEKKAVFFCKHCNALQRPQVNYNLFSLLGIDESFDINTSELSKNYRQLQSLLHPDKFSNASDHEKVFSADISSYVNKAYLTLSNPYKRGLYILSLYQVPILEENTSLNKEFLMEVMDLNEELESISSRNHLNEFYSRNKQTLDQILLRVSEAFNRQDFDTARIALMEMKYFTTLELKIKEKMLLLEELQ